MLFGGLLYVLFGFGCVDHVHGVIVDSAQYAFESALFFVDVDCVSLLILDGGADGTERVEVGGVVPALCVGGGEFIDAGQVEGSVGLGDGVVLPFFMVVWCGFEHD